MEALLDYVVRYGYYFIFVGIFFEGEIVLFTGGFLSSRGDLDLGMVIAVAAAATMAADNVFYWIGRAQTRGAAAGVVGRILGRVGEERIRKGEDFFRRHGGKSLLLIRFLYGFRFAGTTAAGLMRMSFRRFFFYNLIAALLWSTLVSGLGYLFGRSWESLPEGLKYTQFALAALIVVGIWLWFLSRRVRKKKMAGAIRQT